MPAEAVAHLIGAALEYGRDLVGGKCQPLRGQIQPVEARRQLDQRRIAPIAHIPDDRSHDVIHIRRILSFHREHLGEAGIEVGLGGREKDRHGGLGMIEPC